MKADGGENIGVVYKENNRWYIVYGKEKEK